MSMDDVLSHCFQPGRARIFCEIYQRYARLVYVLAFRILSSEEDAEDTTQEVFLKFYHQNRYDMQRGSLKNFLAMSARSRAIDKLRSRQATQRLSTTLQTTTDSYTTQTPLEKVTRIQTICRVQRALQTLPLGERRVLESAYYDNLSQAEIARRFQIPLGTVKSRSRQGLQKMRRILANDLMSAY